VSSLNASHLVLRLVYMYGALSECNIFFLYDVALDILFWDTSITRAKDFFALDSTIFSPLADAVMFHDFQSAFPNINVSQRVFERCKPFFVRSANNKDRVTCCCRYHLEIKYFLNV
jgi:hypothetical protein